MCPLTALPLPLLNNPPKRGEDREERGEIDEWEKAEGEW